MTAALQKSTAVLAAIDGGASKTILRLLTPDGVVLGEGRSGPANVATDPDQACASIEAALCDALIAAQLQRHDIGRDGLRVYAGAGVAGAEVAGRAAAIRDAFPDFAALVTRTDAYTSCLGAHGGKDGAVVAIGTGSVGYAISGDQSHRVGGWGFPQGDEGGGAWIGLQAVRHVLHCHDGREPKTDLFQRIWAKLDQDGTGDPLGWAIGASASRFATLTPIVISASHDRDHVASKILYDAAKEIANISSTLLKNKPFLHLPLSILGGLAPILLPYLPETTKKLIVAPKGDALDGAASLARKAWMKQEALFQGP
ncbi:ATPase [Acetobacter sacchari]|uniref:ATPase n=1 Tax=Acetobacter sacchari TaxID=2661687 RepID=A0ABS3LTQ2_9PROT|nr:BadF/BadG/BcrA/BcrD ATPase family protein [Acetobacter sacchari]MBO1359261.1 ATPase [Acetobacter sacchari]